MVTLVDGTQVPFTVTADKATVDHQLNLFWDPETVKYLRADLENALKREQSYREENERYERERKSPDHALAALLASGAERQTAFSYRRGYIYNNNGQTDIGMAVYSGRGKVAVVIKIKNHLDRLWNLSQARLTSSTDFWQPFSKTRECAVTMEPSSIPPGASGVVAIVADKSAFTAESGGLEPLALQLIRDDGLVGTPGPEKCPAEALKAMEYLRLSVGDGTWIELDANQDDTSPITLYEGPIESYLDDDLGLLESPTRLYGRVWTGGPQVVIRYYEARPPHGTRIPICAVARLAKGQLRKRPDSKPGTAILESSRAGVVIVDDFR